MLQNQREIKQIDQTANHEPDPKPERAYGRAARFVVQLYNGWKDGSLTGRPGQHVTFTSDERLQEQLGLRGFEGQLAQCRTSIVEDAAAEVAAAIRDAELSGWSIEDGFDGLDEDISYGWGITIGAQVEHRLRKEACVHLAVDLGSDPYHIWANHIYRLGQLSVQFEGDDQVSFDGNIPSHWQLAELYNDCARILVEFWPQVQQLAAALQDDGNDVTDPAMPLVPLIFNKRFSTRAAADLACDGNINVTNPANV